MTRKLIDLAALKTAAGEMLSIAQEISESSSPAETGLAAAVGHAGLSNSVSKFQKSWRDELNELEEEIAALGTALKAAAMTFRQMDDEVAKKIAQEIVAAPRG